MQVGAQDFVSAAGSHKQETMTIAIQGAAGDLLGSIVFCLRLTAPAGLGSVHVRVWSGILACRNTHRVLGTRVVPLPTVDLVCLRAPLRILIYCYAHAAVESKYWNPAVLTDVRCPREAHKHCPRLTRVHPGFGVSISVHDTENGCCLLHGAFQTQQWYHMVPRGPTCFVIR